MKIYRFLGHWEYEVTVRCPIQWSHEQMGYPPRIPAPIGVDQHIVDEWSRYLLRICYWTFGNRIIPGVHDCTFACVQEVNAMAQYRKSYEWVPKDPAYADAYFASFAHVIGVPDVRLIEHKIPHPETTVALVYGHQAGWGGQVKEGDEFKNEFHYYGAMTRAWMFISRDKSVDCTNPDRVCFGFAWITSEEVKGVCKVYVHFRAAALWLGFAENMGYFTYKLKAPYVDRVGLMPRTDAWKHW